VDKNISVVEYTTSMKYIHKYLKSEDRILDIGAGTGRDSVARVMSNVLS